MPRIGPRFLVSQNVTLTSNYSNQKFDSLIIQGDALENLRKFKEDYFKCCITSPPYWGLRDYGEPHQIGAEPEMQDYIDNLVQVFREVNIAKANRPTRDDFRCEACGYAGAADHIAAMNIAFRGQVNGPIVAGKHLTSVTSSGL